MATPPRLKELAATLGLSVPTVSLALRNAGNISRKTCQRVQEAAAEMGYRPNPYAAALSTGWQTRDAHEMPLAIVRWPSREGAIYPKQEIVDGIEPRAAELGYRVEQCNLSSPRELPQCLRLLYHRGIQGVFIAPVGDMQEALTLDWSRFCVIACGRYNLQTPFHAVRPEIFESTRSVMSKAMRYGYKRIGAALFRHDPPMIDDYARLAAIQCSEISASLAGGIHEVLLSKPEDDDKLGKWVRAKRLDAVIVFSVGQYHSLVEQGIRVPEDVGVATLHYHDDLYSRHICGVHQQDSEIGRAAANQMDFLIRHHERGIPSVPRHLVIGGKWMEGTTLRDLTLKTPKTSKRGKSAAASAN
jgi:DNA-binding LacI/PurR family transcriptional regulator